MSFLNPIILAGLGLVAIPVILHFLLRQRPKKLLFPALRLLEERRRQSMRKLRLRHVWLLLLRMLALAGLVLAVARPSLPPANYALTRWETLGILLLAGLGVGAHFWNLRGVSGNSSAPQRDERRSQSLRWCTGITLAAILLLVGWPYQRRVAAEIRDPSPTSLDLPVAAVFLFDNSLSLSWQEAGENSLDRARNLAKAHWETFPAGSRLAVAETSVDHPVTFGSTSLAAQTRLDAVALSPLSLPVEDRLREALRAQREDRQRVTGEQSNRPVDQRQDHFLRRIYLFTDLAKSAWRTAPVNSLLNELAEAKGIGLYLVDLGREVASNRAVLEVVLSSPRIPVGGDLLVSATLLAQGTQVPSQSVDLLLLGENDSAVRQGQAQPRLDANVPTRVDFGQLSGLTKPWIAGEVRLPGSDALAFDDVRRFTVESAPPPRVLVTAPSEDIAVYWMLAAEVQRKFRPEFRSISQLANVNFADYQAVTLINVERLSESLWSELGRFVESGGGLIVVLGSADIASENYRQPAAQRFLPATLHSWQPRNDWRLVINPGRRSHPAFSLFRALESQQSFGLAQNLVVVERFWKTVPAESSLVLASFNDPDRSPALIERSLGRGRTLLFNTGVDLEERWSNFADPLGDSWLFLAWVEQLTAYAARFADQQYSFVSGEPVMLQLEVAPAERSFLLSRPGLKQTRHNLSPGARDLTITDAIDPGQYLLLDGSSRQLVKSFSVNVAAAESDLTRLTSDELTARLGEGRFKLARDLDQLEQEINTADLGREVYPMLLMLLVVVFCGELLVSTRFYGPPERAAEQT